MVSRFYIHHSCQSQCGVKRDSQAAVLTEVWEITGVEFTIGASGLEQVFAERVASVGPRLSHLDLKAGSGSLGQVCLYFFLKNMSRVILMLF